MEQQLRPSASGYYAWSRRQESVHAQRDRWLKVLVRASFQASKQQYGSPRIHEDQLEDHEWVSRQTRDSADAGGRPQSARAETLQMYDDERSRPAGRGQSARSAVHGRRTESALGRRHHGVRHRREWEVVVGGDPRPVLAVHRGLGGHRARDHACCCSVAGHSTGFNPSANWSTANSSSRTCSSRG